MKLALIPPFSLLETADTNYHMVLPQLLQNKKYYSFYKNLCQNPDQFVIMDNGAAEGYALEWDKLVEYAIDLGVNEVVAPDTLCDALSTLRKTITFEYEYGDNLTAHNIGIMFVLHGNFWNALYMGMHYASTSVNISSVGIPRSTFDTFTYISARNSIAQKLYERTSKPVHLLGMHSEFIEEIQVSSLHWPYTVRGVDTSAPYNYTASNVFVQEGIAVKRPDNYFNLPLEEFDEYLLEANINYLKGVVDDL